MDLKQINVQAKILREWDDNLNPNKPDYSKEYYQAFAAFILNNATEIILAAYDPESQALHKGGLRG